MKRVTENLEETYALAAELLAEIRKFSLGKGVVVALRGDLGSGKTSFVQGVARALGITEHVTSPTFVLEKLYDINGDPDFSRLVHIDAYRLESEEDLRALRFSELSEDKNLVFVEWPEKVHILNVPTIELTFLDDHRREVDWSKLHI